MNTTRSEHLAWCKARAMEYVAMGDINGAWTSFASDMSSHPETAQHPALMMGMMLLMGGHWRTTQDVKTFIEGFN